MNSLNNILIEGNLVQDPLLRSTPKGTPVCTLRLASNRYYKQDTGFEKETCFFNVETWAKLAEHCSHVGHKGQGIRVTGRLKQDRWKGKDGKTHSRVTIIAEHIAFKPNFSQDDGASGAVRSGEPGGLSEQDVVSESEYADIQEAETIVF
ncbi:MAG: single-stranded DNA-binding protein [Treponema sp.]|nr:single-stranded DNA-binding protein [Treponema sp.]